MAARDNLAIEYFAPSQLKPFQSNARTHSRKQVKQIADSIRVFGFTNPALIDDTNTILAGHGRVAAAAHLGMEAIPCVRLSHMTIEQRRAYVVADNKLALNAGWDEEMLAEELRYLQDIDVGFAVELTGFETHEIDALLDPSQREERSDSRTERLPAIEDQAITQAGDLWQLGPHKLLCGDSTDPVNYETLMAGEKAEMVFTDPPYNVPIAGHVSGLGKATHREFAMASGEMSPDQFKGFLKKTFDLLVASSQDGSIHFVCMDWRHVGEVLAAGRTTYTELKNLCVWVKDNGGMGTFYRSQHEMVFVFKAGTAVHKNNFELGQHGRYRTNVWSYRGMNTRGSDRDSELALHPTVKPVPMIADAIRDVTSRGGIVLDCFSGSGSTLIAAHKTSRKARLIEIDPIYTDRSIRRWEQYARDDAILIATGQTFEERGKELRGGQPNGGP